MCCGSVSSSTMGIAVHPAVPVVPPPLALVVLVVPPPLEADVAPPPLPPVVFPGSLHAATASAANISERPQARLDRIFDSVGSLWGEPVVGTTPPSQRPYRPR